MSSLAAIRGRIPEPVYYKLSLLGPAAQDGFIEEFKRRKKSILVAYIYWFLFNVLGVHYLYFKKPLLFFLFLLTFGGLVLWWVVDLFRIPGIIRKHNDSVSISVLRDIDVLN